MHFIFANTIWAPWFIYRYDTSSVVVSTLLGFTAEWCVLNLYLHALVPPGRLFIRMLLANVTSYLAGNVLIIFVPFEIHKLSFLETSNTFLIAYAITVPAEFLMMRTLLPNKRWLIFRAVT